MKWIRVLSAIWSGDYWKGEREESRKVIEETRRVVDEGRAMLDGEDFWLIPPGKGRSCDYRPK